MTFDLGFLQAGLLLSRSGQSRADIRDLWPTTQDCGSVAPYTEPPASGKLGRPREQQVIAKGHLPPFHTSGSPEIFSLRQNKYSKGQIDSGVRTDVCSLLSQPISHTYHRSDPPSERTQCEDPQHDTVPHGLSGLMPSHPTTLNLPSR